MNDAKFTLYYWPIPFRGCFVSYLFAYRGEPLNLVASFDEIGKLKGLPPSEQPVPFVGPPLLHDLANDRMLSQMPAIVTYLAPKLNLMPKDDYSAAMCLKILMDCNDVLMEICRYNGSSMWEPDTWREFRNERLPRWMQIFAESQRRGYFGSGHTHYADIAVYALFGNMIRSLPELRSDLEHHAPDVLQHCQSMQQQQSLADYVQNEAEQFGDYYCGGMIEKSIRAQL